MGRIVDEWYTKAQEDNPCYDAQIEFCQSVNAPTFAHRYCTHRFSLMHSMIPPMSLTEMLVDKHRGDMEAALEEASTTLITGCPKCGLSWCD